MSIGLQIARAVAKELDNDDVYARAKNLGNKAMGLKRSQISGLENIANGSRKVSDVLDYLKLRTARHKEWQNNGIGAELLHELEQELRKLRDGIWKELEQQVEQQVKADERDYVRQDVYMRLIRGYVAQVAAQYEYASMQQGRAIADGYERH